MDDFEDSLGQIKYEEHYAKGKMIATTQDTTQRALSSMPRFSGCEGIEGSNEEKKMCADKKMLQYIYSRIKYPKKARRLGIEGTAIVSFVIAKNGAVKNIKVKKGLMKEIGQECLKVVKNMPTWKQGIINGESVAVEFNLPIKFRLE